MKESNKIIDRSHNPIRFLAGYRDCAIIITEQNFRSLLLDHIYTTENGELRCGLESNLKSRNIKLYDKSFIDYGTKIEVVEDDK